VCTRNQGPCLIVPSFLTPCKPEHPLRCPLKMRLPPVYCSTPLLSRSNARIRSPDILGHVSRLEEQGKHGSQYCRHPFSANLASGFHSHEHVPGGICRVAGLCASTPRCNTSPRGSVWNRPQSQFLDPVTGPRAHYCTLGQSPLLSPFLCLTLLPCPIPLFLLYT
jgi:hypothetical protein